MKTIAILTVLLSGALLSNAQPTALPGKFIHSVYFWLKNPESEADRNEFLDHLTRFISGSKYVTSYHIAPPAGTPREVVDNTYTYNLLVTFENAALQDLYQKEDVHVKFVEDASHLWDRVQIYDSYPGISMAAPYQRNDIQVGVVVSDLDRSVDFYTNILGMVRTGGFSIDKDFANRSGLSNGTPFDVAVLRTSNSPAASEWKLMSFGKKSEDMGKFINEGLGMRYITLFPNDLDAVISRLKEAGVEFLGDTPTPLDDGRRFVLIKDPDGVFIELIGD